MGSLTSRPSVPSTPQIVYVPQATTTTASAVSTDSAADTTSNAAEPLSSQSASEVRAQNLLGRERSRFGTVLTGFRGLLDTLDNRPERKTLLGQ